jgi:AcrR family transcriptional regulator
VTERAPAVLTEGPGKRGRDGARTRALIEREALKLFADKGVDGTSVKDISSAVGVADAALYRHFASKEEMAHGIFVRHYAELAASIREIDASDLPFAQKAAALVLHFCRLFDEEPDVFAFLLLNQHARLRFVPAEGDGNAVEALSRMMAEARRRGEIAVDDPDLAAAMALGAVVQPATFALYGRITRPLGARAQELTIAALAAVGASA